MSEHHTGAVYFKGKWFIKGKLQRWNKKGVKVGSSALVHQKGVGDAPILSLSSSAREGSSEVQVGKHWVEFLLFAGFFFFFSKMKFQWLCSSCSQTCLGFLGLVFESCMKLLKWQQAAAWFSSEQWPEKWETKACVVPGQCSVFSGMLPGPLVRALLICVIYQRWEGFGSKMQ